MFGAWTVDDGPTPWNGEVPLGAEIKSSFREITTSLVITRAGSGSGSVTSVPAGIDCGATCTATFPEESTVTLTPEAAAGSSFAGWSGACSGTGTCTVTIGEDQSSIGAEFVSAAPQPAPPGAPAAAAPAPALKIVPACASKRFEVIHWSVRRGIHLHRVTVLLDGAI